MSIIYNELRPLSVAALVAGNAIAIWVPKFMPEEVCRSLARQIQESDDLAYSGPGYLGLGPDRAVLPDGYVRYFQSAPRIDGLLQEVIHALARDLQSIRQPRINGTDPRMRALTVKLMGSGFHIPPHKDNDYGEKNWTWAAEQLSLELTLSPPRSGGGLKLWDTNLDPADLLPRQGAFDESRLPRCKIQLYPDVGDLIIYRANRVHGTERIETGEQLSVTGFLAPGGANGTVPFYLWS